MQFATSELFVISELAVCTQMKLGTLQPTPGPTSTCSHERKCVHNSSTRADAWLRCDPCLAAAILAKEEQWLVDLNGAFMAEFKMAIQSSRGGFSQKLLETAC